jgi:hypothetical protein
VRFETVPDERVQANVTVMQRDREALLAFAFVATLGDSRATCARG